MRELGRDAVIAGVQHAMEPLEYVIAMWEGGSAAWGREDRWSDIDLQLLVEDDRVSETIATVERVLSGLGTIELRFEAPRPTWHGHEQVFYRLREAGEYRLVDLAVMRRSAPQQLREQERHGERRICFDKTGEARPIPLDRALHARRVAERLAQLSVAFPLFQSLVKKELHRQNHLGALGFYHSHTLQPLLTLLRIQHCPDRFDFGPRYAAIDLPPAVLRRLEPLWFVRDAADLERKRAEAETLFFEVLEAIRRAGAGAS